ncbi:MAG: recombinase family protein [Lachnospiraceae bacterium]|nr:recombinase family protein [Lachnospiraceae bacterium]MBR6152075.1 recombinase family protein [Lachnospiraceae bacterium]
MEKYGYVRVSSKEQNTDRQLDALTEMGIQRSHIFIDKLSGKDFCRPQYQKMLKKLRRGDLVIIMSIDRLGRNYEEILNQWKVITKEKEANIKVLDMPLLNTYETKDGLTGMFVADLVLQILAYVAEMERTFIRQRQAEGIAAAKKRGVKFGPARTSNPEGLTEYCEKWHRGEVTIREAAAILGVSNSTFYRRCKELKGREDCFLN